MSMFRFAALAVLFTAAGCAPQRVVFTDDEVPEMAMAVPLEASAAGDLMGREDDPPTRVMRLNHAEGAVSRQPPGMDEWAPAVVNLPLGTGDNLWVAPGGRAELHAGSTALRLASESGLDVLRLDNRALQLGLPQGSLELQVQPGPEVDSVEVDTPDGAVLLDRAGDYRVDAAVNGAPDRVTVRSGQAEVTSAGVTVPVNAGTTMELAGGQAPHYDLVAAGEPDGFDQWCGVRQRRESSSESAIYLGRDLTGYEDLEGQGTWQLNKTYGTTWAPRVSADWAPYRDGSWIWAEPYGWTWVDKAPWGFATSHYGRWTHSGGAWLWVPGPRTARPVYAPALVAFTGGPGMRGAAASGAAVAWFPLGPREPYQPAYPASRAYVQSLNPGSLPLGTAGHLNQAVPGAMTVVPQSVFLGARPVAGANLALRGSALGQGWRVGSAPALVPQRESVLATPSGTPLAARPPFDPARPLMVRNHLPQAAVPFEARQRALAAGYGRPLANPVLNGLRRQQPFRAIPARLATAPTPGGPLRPVGPMFAPQAAPPRAGGQGALLRPDPERDFRQQGNQAPGNRQQRGPGGPGMRRQQRPNQGRRPGAGRPARGQRREERRGER
jgi:hypothetical protein